MPSQLKRPIWTGGLCASSAHQFSKDRQLRANRQRRVPPVPQNVMSAAHKNPRVFVSKGRYWTTVQWRKKNGQQQYVYKFELAMERDMLSRAEEYRQRARDCEQAARETIDAGMKALFQELGNQWLRLAGETELPDQKNAMRTAPLRRTANRVQ
jgi:hypothetical protein